MSFQHCWGKGIGTVVVLDRWWDFNLIWNLCLFLVLILGTVSSLHQSTTSLCYFHLSSLSFCRPYHLFLSQWSGRRKHHHLLAISFPVALKHDYFYRRNFSTSLKLRNFSINIWRLFKKYKFLALASSCFHRQIQDTLKKVLDGNPASVVASLIEGLAHRFIPVAVLHECTGSTRGMAGWVREAFQCQFLIVILVAKEGTECHFMVSFTLCPFEMTWVPPVQEAAEAGL